MIKTLIFNLCLLLSAISQVEGSIIKILPNDTYIVDEHGSVNKIYIDEEEMRSTYDSFHIHVGSNMWIETPTIHRDASGLYTFESDISMVEGAYEKKWRCPYCNSYWSIGQACQNPNCPSKYK